MQIGSLSTKPAHRGQSLATVPFFYLKVSAVGATLLEFRESQQSKSQLPPNSTGQPAFDPRS